MSEENSFHRINETHFVTRNDDDCSQSGKQLKANSHLFHAQNQQDKFESQNYYDLNLHTVTKPGFMAKTNLVSR